MLAFTAALAVFLVPIAPTIAADDVLITPPDAVIETSSEAAETIAAPVPAPAEVPAEEIGSTPEETETLPEKIEGAEAATENVPATDAGTDEDTESAAVPTEPAEPTPAIPDEPADQMPGEQIIVKFKEHAAGLDTGRGTLALETLADQAGLTLEEHLPEANSAVFTTTGETAEEAAARLASDPSVEYAEPNYARTMSVIDTDDEYRADLWALDNTGQTVEEVAGTPDADIDAPEAWTLSTGTSTLVAVIDTGVLYTHPDLAANLWDGTSCVSATSSPVGNCIHGYDFSTTTANPLDPAPLPGGSTHGTHVAGIIAAAKGNGIGVIGVAPSATIMAIKFNLDVASEVKAIDFARVNGAKIINASFGGAGFSQAEHDAIERFRAAGGIFIAAAGNSHADNDAHAVYPANYALDNIISVAATDQHDGLADYSNYGDTSVDLGAPGSDILSTVTTDGTDAAYGYLSGTSMAAPMVAGAVALAWSLYPDYTAAQIRSALLSSGDPLPSLASTTVSGKRLNAYALLTQLAALDTTPPVITLNGDAVVHLTAGGSYDEQGATAVDEQDGPVAVVIGGDVVEANRAGTYHVTYDAADAAGNHALQVVREVIVAAAPRRSGGGGGGGGGGAARTTEPVRVLFDAPAAPLFSADFGIGASGAAVTSLQNLLARLGVYAGPVTGFYGALTAAAVSSFQTANGLPATGSLDAATRTLLNQRAGPVASPDIAAIQAQISALLSLLSILQARLAALGA